MKGNKRPEQDRGGKDGVRECGKGNENGKNEQSKAYRRDKETDKTRNKERADERDKETDRTRNKERTKEAGMGMGTGMGREWGKGWEGARISQSRAKGDQEPRRGPASTTSKHSSTKIIKQKN